VNGPSLKAAYGITELARMSGMSRQQVYRRIKKHQLASNRQPYEKLDVPLVAFRDAFPEIWDSILLRLSFT
jgi:predicted DNA-binding transcriptional regulator AlpA